MTQITINIREIENGFIVSDQYGECLGYRDNRPLERHFSTRGEMLDMLPQLAGDALTRQVERDAEYQRMMENESLMSRAGKQATRYPHHAPVTGVGRAMTPEEIAAAGAGTTTLDDGDPHNLAAEEGDRDTAMLRTDPVMDTSGFKPGGSGDGEQG